MDNTFLEVYGKVEQFEEKDNQLHVKITDGFSGYANPTFELMGKIQEAYPQYPKVVKCTTDTNLFHLILK